MWDTDRSSYYVGDCVDHESDAQEVECLRSLVHRVSAHLRARRVRPPMTRPTPANCFRGRAPGRLDLSVSGGNAHLNVVCWATQRVGCEGVRGKIEEGVPGRVGVAQDRVPSYPDVKLAFGGQPAVLSPSIGGGGASALWVGCGESRVAKGPSLALRVLGGWAPGTGMGPWGRK